MFTAKSLVHYNVMLNIQVKTPVLHKGTYYLGYVYFVIGKYKSPYFICNLWVLCKHIASVKIYSTFAAEYPTSSLKILIQTCVTNSAIKKYRDVFCLMPVLNKWFMNATLCFKAFFCCISVSIPPNHPDNLKCLRLRKKSISLACSSMSALFTSSQLCSTSRPVSQWNLPAPLKVCFSLPRAGDENRVWHFGKNHHARQSL